MKADILLLSSVFLPSFAALLILLCQDRQKIFIAVSVAVSVSLFLILLGAKTAFGW